MYSITLLKSVHFYREAIKGTTEIMQYMGPLRSFSFWVKEFTSMEYYPRPVTGCESKEGSVATDREWVNNQT